MRRDPLNFKLKFSAAGDYGLDISAVEGNI